MQLPPDGPVCGTILVDMYGIKIGATAVLHMASQMKRGIWNWLKSRWIHAWVLALDGALDILGGTNEVDLPDILLGWCSGFCLLWSHIDPPGDGFVLCALFAVSVVGCMKQTNKNLRCDNRKGLLSRNDQTHQRMGPKTMESIPPSKRNTQADIQLRTRQIVAPANKAPAGD